MNMDTLKSALNTLVKLSLIIGTVIACQYAGILILAALPVGATFALPATTTALVTWGTGTTLLSLAAFSALDRIRNAMGSRSGAIVPEVMAAEA